MEEKRSSADIAELLEKAKNGARSLVDFRREFLPLDLREVSPAQFHYKWSDVLLFSGDSYAIEGFRESSKTSFVVDVYPQYKIFYPDEYITYIVLLKQNATLAAKSLKEIERNVMENRWISGKVLRVIEQSGEAFELVTIEPMSGREISIRVEAYGKGSSIRGLKWRNKRPSIVLADDLQDEEDASSQAALDSDWRWFRSEVGFLGQYTRFFMIANNLGEKCIIEQIASDPEQFGFIFDRVPIISDVSEDGVSAWPERFSKEFILDEYKKYSATGDVAIWMRNRMCVSVSAETQVFKKDDLRWYHPNEKGNIITRCNVFISCDFAATVKATSDYTAFVVLGVDEDDYWYVLDVWYGRWDGPEQVKKLFDLVREYKPYRVGIETVGAHGGLIHQTITKAMTDERCIFSMSGITPSRKHSKEERIEMALGQRVRLNKLLLPEKAGWLDELMTELQMFTREGAKSKHDDLIDALSQGAQFAKAPVSKDTAGRAAGRYKDLPRSSIGSNVFR
jgi:predicted phage terminase large subunit-like protein